MRITKAALRKAKIQAEERIKDICNLSYDQTRRLAQNEPALLEEHRKLYPHLPDGERPAFASAILRDLLEDCLSTAIPSYWTD